MLMSTIAKNIELSHWDEDQETESNDFDLEEGLDEEEYPETGDNPDEEMLE